MKKLFLNLGQNLIRENGTGIFADAKKVFPNYEKLVVLHLENDRLLEGAKALLPEDAEFVAVRKDGTIVGEQPEVGIEDVFVLNGGRTPQNHAMQILSLLSGELWDLQPAPEEPVKLARLLHSSDKAKAEILSLASEANQAASDSPNVEYIWWAVRNTAMSFLRVTKEQLIELIRTQ